MLSISLSLPIADPVLKFLIILVIILAAPLILNRFRIPSLIGLIIAGAVIGPNGFNLVLRDSSIILSGTAGLLYIMFLAGLEINMNDFKRNSGKSLLFGFYTFIVPMLLGYAASRYLLGFSDITSVLLASMFASHTLIAYPIVSRLGVGRNIAVTVTAGGTVITDTLALLVLTVIVGMTTGEVNNEFWIKLGTSILLFVLFIIVVFPLVTRWFLKKVEDGISQYIFVLALVFLGAFLAELAGLEAIIGAFMAGLAINRLVPATSRLMNRIEFVGNAIFIPFFLLGVGMLIDYKAFFTDIQTIIVGLMMIVVATASKWIAAWLAQKSFGYSVDQRRLIFGLSNAQAAATLAAVTVGYNIIIGTAADGTPIRLLNDAILNGTILMILVTCTIASFSAQKGARNIAIADEPEDISEDFQRSEKMLVSVKKQETVDELINICAAIKEKKTEFLGLNVVNNKTDDEKTVKYAKKVLNNAVVAAASCGNDLEDFLRYDISRTNAVIGVVKERQITDLVMDFPDKFADPDNKFSRYNEGILSQNDTTIYLCRPLQSLSTVKRHFVVVPDRAEREVGFSLWLRKIWNLTVSTGCKVVFYTSPSTQAVIKEFVKRHSMKLEFRELYDWSDFLIMARDLKPDDMIWTVLSRKDKPSYSSSMAKIPGILYKYFNDNGFIILYPAQSVEVEGSRYLT